MKLNKTKLKVIKKNVLYAGENGQIPASLGLQLIMLFDHFHVIQCERDRYKQIVDKVSREREEDLELIRKHQEKMDLLSGKINSLP